MEDKSLKGVGINVREGVKLKFASICERICLGELDTGKGMKICLLCAQASTEEETRKNPGKTESFYNKLSTVINTISNRNILIVGGDFNARIKLDESEKDSYKEIVGKYALNTINENEKLLVELCKIHNLKITNTFFRHKKSQQTTWASVVKPSNARINSYRFQIDYIAVRKNEGVKIYDSRSYNIMKTNSDHKPIIAHLKIHMTNKKPIKTKHKINIEAFHCNNKQEE